MGEVCPLAAALRSSLNPVEGLQHRGSVVILPGHRRIHEPDERPVAVGVRAGGFQERTDEPTSDRHPSNSAGWSACGQLYDAGGHHPVTPQHPPDHDPVTHARARSVPAPAPAPASPHDPAAWELTCDQWSGRGQGDEPSGRPGGHPWADQVSSRRSRSAEAARAFRSSTESRVAAPGRPVRVPSGEKSGAPGAEPGGRW